MKLYAYTAIEYDFKSSPISYKKFVNTNSKKTGKICITRPRQSPYPLVVTGESAAHFGIALIEIPLSNI
jgi:hypothetical protein